MSVDRIIKKENEILVSIDRTKYKSWDRDILQQWYPKEYNSMKLVDITDDEGYINYIFDMEENVDFDVSEFTVLEKLTCAYSLFQYKVLFDKGYQASFDDENIFLSKGNEVVLLFIENKNLYSGEFETSEFFTQCKARILSMFTRYSFNDLIKSNFTLQMKTTFEKAILDAESEEEIKAIICQYIDEKRREEKQNYVFAPKKIFVGYRIASFVLMVLFVGVSIFSLINYYGKVKPLEFDNSLYSHFVAQDYSKVIDLSRNVTLSKEQKYIVGYSAIETSSLDNKKKQVILTTYNINVSEAILEYWVFIGQGNYKEAANRGKAVNNDEYVLYALRLEENRLLNNDTMDGSEKESALKSVQGEIKDYEEKLKVDEPEKKEEITPEENSEGEVENNE